MSHVSGICGCYEAGAGLWNSQQRLVMVSVSAVSWFHCYDSWLCDWNDIQPTKRGSNSKKEGSLNNILSMEWTTEKLLNVTQMDRTKMDRNAAGPCCSVANVSDFAAVKHRFRLQIISEYGMLLVLRNHLVHLWSLSTSLQELSSSTAFTVDCTASATHHSISNQWRYGK